MKNSQVLLCFSLILCGLVTECFGYTLMPKDKRGWTLNSAGYLLGPRPAIRRGSSRVQGTEIQRVRKNNAHRTLTDKVGTAGKRETGEDMYKPAREVYSNQLYSLDENTIQTVLDFLSYLRLKELGGLDHNGMLISEESTQP